MEVGGHGHYGILALLLVVADCRAGIGSVTILCPNMVEKSALAIPKAPVYAALKTVPLVEHYNYFS